MEFQIVQRLVEIILGEDLRNESAKPGGTQAGIYEEVAEWIDLVVASGPRIRTLAKKLPADQRALAVACLGSEVQVCELERFEPEQVCRQGFAWIGEESQRRFEKNFLNAGGTSQVEIVLSISDGGRDKAVEHAGTRLFDLLKAECIRGFYTSHIGLKELDYKGNAFYGAPPECSLRPAQKPAEIVRTPLAL
jgi:hypothetical protein